MPIRIDLHTHSHFSVDGTCSPDELIEAARNRGIDGIALTDHDTCEGVLSLMDKGVIREDGLPFNDFLVIPGMEISTAEGHLLCIGAVLPELKGRPALEACEIIHLHGGLAIPAHPFDCFRSSLGKRVMSQLPIDAVETFNAASTLAAFNWSSKKFAQEHGLAEVAGSDAHTTDAVGRAHVVLDIEENTFSKASVLQALRQPGNELSCQYSTFIQRAKKCFYTLLRHAPCHYPAPPAESLH